MRQEELVEILIQHAEKLNQGIDNTDLLLTYYGEKSGEIRALLQLAQQLSEVLVPVSPTAVFATQLQRRLLQGRRERYTSLSRPLPRRLWMLAATVGSLLSVAGLTWFIRRYMKVDEASQPAPGSM